MPASDAAEPDIRWSERRPPEDFYRLLMPDGTMVGERPACSDEELVRWYRVMVETRMFEALTIRMQRRGEISVAGSSRGEEAVGVGAAAALQPGDWCYPSYRQMSALHYCGVPLENVVAAMMSAPPEHIAEHLPLARGAAPPAVQLVPYAIFLAASIPHATGSALADKLNARRHVTLAFCGEGATSEGDFYEGINFAGALHVPLVVIVQNNQWCISVPAHRQSAVPTFAHKAVAAGLRHERVDGNDVFAVYQKTHDAVQRARDGDGPSLIEAVTYRMEDHNTADSAALYRRDPELDYWRTRDPVDRFERYLESTGLVTESDRQRIAAEADARLRAAIARSRTVPAAPAELMFANHLLGSPGWSFERQREHLRRELAGQSPFDLDSAEPLR
jgi:pyruvate dehydrogenase E1 component alpha subunit